MATLVLLLTALRVPAGAQHVEREPLFSGSDAAWAGGFLAGAVLIAPVDRAVAAALQDPASQENALLRHTATVFRVAAHPGAVLGVTGAYAIGRLADDDGLADVGLHAGASFALAEAATYLVKVIAGRARPYADPGDSFNFGLLRGLRDEYQSFPSGHTTAAFAVASALTSEAGVRSPGDQWWIGTLLYSMAGLSGLSRMYENQHWASDVLVGAGIGTFAGWKVVHYTHSHEGNELDGIFLNLAIRPGAGASLIVLPRAWSPLAN